MPRMLLEKEVLNAIENPPLASGSAAKMEGYLGTFIEGVIAGALEIKGAALSIVGSNEVLMCANNC